ncbi:tetratricopeptide repeat protein [Mangrovibacterium sp.]|uniref:tetratricopeptide repeat protein n=1 Tax=Mangrovibacterium sp. TaxID=1961364 RepID=UPI00356350AD
MTEMKPQIDKIRDLITENQLAEATCIIQDGLATRADDADLHFLLGQINVKQEKWGSAINQFNRVLEIDPDYPAAQSRIEMARSILGYFNPDLLNP